MDEKIFLSNKESKTIAELKAIGGINFPVFKDGTKMYKTSLDELLSASTKTVILPYETATYAIINEIAQSGKQVIIHYTGVDGAQFWTLSHTAELSYVFTRLNGNSLVKMILSSENVWSEEAIDLKAIKDNARDDVTDPMQPDNITDIEQLTFVRNVGVDANYTMVESEKRIYGVLIPHPSMQADHGKVPMYKTGNQIAWENVPNEESVDDQISSAVQNLQTKLTFDTTPTADSTNPVTSGGIKTALDAKQNAFTIVEASASTTGSTATVSIEQGDLCIVDLSEEASLTAIEIVLTNNSEAAFPLWWFKVESGSAATLSVKIGAVAVGWLDSEITNIALGKTVEVSVVDGIACGGELV